MKTTSPDRVTEQAVGRSTHVDRPRLLATLRETFGHEIFRAEQEAIIHAVLAGRSVLAVLPTGGGKSLCYQLPAALSADLTIVVSPLIALMKDQVDRLERIGLPIATRIHSGLTPVEVRNRLASITGGERRLLFCAPERLQQPEFAAALARRPIGLFVVDEAHCVSQWGHDFRPPYRTLGDLIARLRPRSVLAVTATATPRVREDIAAVLGMDRPQVHVASFDRPNLTWRVEQIRDSAKRDRLRDLLQTRPGAAIVYVARRRDADELAAMLTESGESALPYHAELPPEERSRAQEAFASGSARIIVATVAFGMGIDKPDVRTVIHYHLPASLEAYYQEAGRAGRDGDPAEAHVLFDPRDAGIHHYFLRLNYPDLLAVRRVYSQVQARKSLDELARDPGWSLNRVNVALGILESQGFITRGTNGRHRAGETAPGAISPDLNPMWERQQADFDRLESAIDYATSPGCRRAALLRYFGEETPEGQNCGRCDRCELTGARSIGERVARFLSRQKENATAMDKEGTSECHPEASAKREPKDLSPLSARVRSLALRPLGGRVARDDTHSMEKVSDQPPKPLPDGADAAILAAVRDLQRFHLGVTGVSKVLCGSRSHLIDRLRLAESPHYGRLAGTGQKAIAEAVLELVRAGRLRRTAGALPAVECIGADDAAMQAE